jgi:hypothetical protein
MPEREAQPAPLRTTALCLFPNPAVLGTLGRGSAPLLALEEARLLAAAMRALLPTMYRGAEESLAVELSVATPSPGPEHPLGPDDGFVIYDLHHGGSGAAHAVFNDGVEPLLRLCRLFLERVLYHDRLRARFDTWGDAAAVLSGADSSVASGPTVGSIDAATLAERRERDEANRHRALAFLDSRLRPEVGAGSIAVVGQFGSGRESGEGDLFDLGRAWYSHDGSVTSLVWCKHRWHLESGGEAAVDVGFDRQTAAEARWLTRDSQAIADYRELLAAHRERAGTWGDPVPAWGRGPEPGAPVCTEGLSEPAAQQAVADYHNLAAAIAAHSFPALAPLAGLLSQRVGADADGERRRLRLATYLARFVQGIPYSVPGAVEGGLRAPLSTLLYRLGDCDSKSLLLALLLQHCDIDAGLFISLRERHALAAVAVPLPFTPAEGLAGVERAGPNSEGRVDAWSRRAGLAEPVQLWAVLPESPRATSRLLLYVPVETTEYAPVGASRVTDARQWVFLPLTAVWLRLRPTAELLPVDRAEAEVEP